MLKNVFLRFLKDISNYEHHKSLSNMHFYLEYCLIKSMHVIKIERQRFTVFIFIRLFTFDYIKRGKYRWFKKYT